MKVATDIIDLLGSDTITDWRQGQLELVQRILDSDKRFVVLNAPTGSGKSVIYLAVAMALEARAAVLTGTKALQDQLSREFGMVVQDIRGAGNYPCIVGPDNMKCDEGACTFGEPCEEMEIDLGGECHYYKELASARKWGQVVSTNYAYWLAMQNLGKGLGDKFGLLILDEAHAAEEWVLNYGTANFSADAIEWVEDGLGIKAPGVKAKNDEWRQWAVDVSNRVEAGVEVSGDNFKVAKMVRTDSFKAKRLDDSWVVTRAKDREGRLKVRIEPTNARRLKGALFQDVKKVLLTSATVTKHHLYGLGVADAEIEFIDVPSTFPRANRPFIYVPRVKVKYGWGEGEKRQWVNAIDQIIAGRDDRKGIVHCGSYDRCKLLMDRSRYREFMISHGRAGAWDTWKSVDDAVQEFKAEKDPVILVSPSVMTGFDFPHDECRYQIIAKIPFPSIKDPALKLRTERFKDLPKLIAATSMAQAYGRGVRASDDWCETFLIDKNMDWFYHAAKQFIPIWVLEAYRKSVTIPKPRQIQKGGS